MAALIGNERVDDIPLLLNQMKTIRVYDLKATCVRLDTTTSSGYRAVAGEGFEVTPSPSS